MATLTPDLAAEFDALAAPFIASGDFTNTTEVIRAAMLALRRQLEERDFDEACIKAADEGDASGEAEGDIFAEIRAKYGLEPYKR